MVSCSRPWKCSGGPSPTAFTASSTASSPPDCSPLTMNVISPPSGLRTCAPSPAAMATPSFFSFISILLNRLRWFDAVPAHPLLDLRDHRLDHGDARVSLRVARDQMPDGVRLDAGSRPHVLDRLVVSTALLPIAPVIVGQLPCLEGILLPLLEALQLLLGGDVQPELDQDHPLVRQRALEPVDLVIGAEPLLPGRESLHPLDQHAPVPGAVEDRHPAPAGQRRPESPE